MSGDVAGEATLTGSEGDGSDPAALHHEALVYASAAEFLDRAVPFLRAAVESGERALAVSAPGRLELLANALDGRASDVDFVDAGAWYQVPAWTISAYHEYVHRHDGRPVRIVGEPVWSDRTEDQVVEWHRYESILNVALAGSNASILCAYDAQTLAPEIIDAVGQTHPSLCQRAGIVRSAGYLQPLEYTTTYQVGMAPRPAGALVIGFTLDDLAMVRRTAAGWGAAEGLTEHGVQELLIAVHEVVSNAVEHGGGRGVARFWATPEDVICEVTSPRRIEIPFPGYLPPDPRQERGRGLWMARQICSRVDIGSGEAGARIRLTLSRATISG